MSYLIVYGDDVAAVRAARATFAANAAVDPAHVQHFDLTDPDALATSIEAITGFSLFGEPRLFELAGLEALDAPSVSVLAGALGGRNDSDHILVWGRNVGTAAHKILGPLGPQQLNLGPAGADRRLGELAAQYGIALDADALAHLRAKVGEDTAAAASVLYSLAITGVGTASPEMIDRFAHFSATRGTPWGVVDALHAGDLATALTLADTVSPLAVLGFLATRLGQAGRIVETPLTTAREVAGAFGIGNLGAADALLSHAQRLGARGIAESWRLVSEADVAVKSHRDHERAVLDLYLVKLARAWSTSATAA